jgi:antitoxin CptB
MSRDTRLKRLRFRAWHRGTREADTLVGGFFDAFAEHWDEAELDWFDSFLEEQDVDVVAWAMGLESPPPHLAGPMMAAFCKLDYISQPR